CARDHSNFDYW
nr:immunoglobulin heavy chain junction region [Macaca mulatta]MOX02364.1 immunoglobulin heavy chain junction region [Macaca mulatta]MOX05620.1 immunoglobulin heavy chain junction region [Macaca mulatta]